MSKITDSHYGSPEAPRGLSDAPLMADRYDPYLCGLCEGTGSYRDITNAGKHYSDAAGTTPCRNCLDGVVWVLKSFEPHWPATEPLTLDAAGKDGGR